jgi:hypothetical protein
MSEDEKKEKGKKSEEHPSNLFFQGQNPRFAQKISSPPIDLTEGIARANLGKSKREPFAEILTPPQKK